MANFGGWFKLKLKRLLTYLVGTFFILIILAVGGFYVAKPYILTIAQQKMASRGIQADDTEIGIFGSVLMKNITVPVPAGVKLKIDSLSGRPPIKFIPGSFTLYNIVLETDKIRVTIPSMSLSGFLLKDKDPSITSNVLQALMRIETSSIKAPDIKVSLIDQSGPAETVDIKNFWVSNFKDGYIQSVGIGGMNSNVAISSFTSNTSDVSKIYGKSNQMEMQDIDLGYAYSLLAGKILASTTTDNTGKTIFGNVNLSDIMVDISDSEKGNVHFSLESFKTSGLKMKAMKQAPEELAKEYLLAKKSNNKDAEKLARNTLITEIVGAITSIDAQINKVDINLPQIKTKLESFELQPRQWSQAIPESFLISLNGLSIDTTQLPSKNADVLKEMGFTTLDLSGKLDFSYNDSRKTLALNTLQFDAKNIGSGEMSAKIVDVEPTLFSGDKTQIIEAANQLGVTEIDMRYSDYGFIDKFFTYLAHKMNDSKHDLKQELYDDFFLVMTQSPILLLKDSKEAVNISTAFGEFAKKPGTISISLKAKDKKGLTAVDLDAALQNELSATLNKVDLTVKNQ